MDDDLTVCILGKGHVEPLILDGAQEPPNARALEPGIIGPVDARYVFRSHSKGLLLHETYVCRIFHEVGIVVAPMLESTGQIVYPHQQSYDIRVVHIQ